MCITRAVGALALGCSGMARTKLIRRIRDSDIADLHSAHTRSELKHSPWAKEKPRVVRAGLSLE